MDKRLFIIFWVAALVWMPTAVKAFGVSPAIIELSAPRGETIESSFTIINANVADQMYYLEAVKFTAREDSGAPEFIPYEEDHAGLPEWIRFEQETFIVPATSKAEIGFEVAVPADVSSGGYYAAVVVSDTPYDVVATNGATVSAKIAVLLFLTVEGETVKKAALLDFVSPDKISWFPSMSYVYRIQNQGNVHLAPRATITVRDVFGRVVLVEDANPEGSRVLPGTTRSFSGELGPTEPLSFADTLRVQLSSFAIGPVSYTLEVEEGASDQTQRKTLKGWVLPIELITVVAAAAAVVLLLYRLITRRK